MKTTSAGPSGNRYAGQEYPVSAEEGEALVAAGCAEWVHGKVEVAVAPTPENAARQVGRRRK